MTKFDEVQKWLKRTDLTNKTYKQKFELLLDAKTETGKHIFQLKKGETIRSWDNVNTAMGRFKNNRKYIKENNENFWDQTLMKKVNPLNWVNLQNEENEKKELSATEQKDVIDQIIAENKKFKKDAVYISKNIKSLRGGKRKVGSLQDEENEKVENLQKQKTIASEIFQDKESKIDKKQDEEIRELRKQNILILKELERLKELTQGQKHEKAKLQREKAEEKTEQRHKKANKIRQEQRTERLQQGRERMRKDAATTQIQKALQRPQVDTKRSAVKDLGMQQRQQTKRTEKLNSMRDANRGATLEAVRMESTKRIDEAKQFDEEAPEVPQDDPVLAIKDTPKDKPKTIDQSTLQRYDNGYMLAERAYPKGLQHMQGVINTDTKKDIGFVQLTDSGLDMGVQGTQNGGHWGKNLSHDGFQRHAEEFLTELKIDERIQEWKTKHPGKTPIIRLGGHSLGGMAAQYVAKHIMEQEKETGSVELKVYSIDAPEDLNKNDHDRINELINETNTEVLIVRSNNSGVGKLTTRNGTEGPPTGPKVTYLNLGSNGEFSMTDKQRGTEYKNPIIKTAIQFFQAGRAVWNKGHHSMGEIDKLRKGIPEDKITNYDKNYENNRDALFKREIEQSAAEREQMKPPMSSIANTTTSATVSQVIPPPAAPNTDPLFNFRMTQAMINSLMTTTATITTAAPKKEKRQRENDEGRNEETKFMYAPVEEKDPINVVQEKLQKEQEMKSKQLRDSRKQKLNYDSNLDLYIDPEKTPPMGPAKADYNSGRRTPPPTLGRTGDFGRVERMEVDATGKIPLPPLPRVKTEKANTAPTPSAETYNAVPQTNRTSNAVPSTKYEFMSREHLQDLLNRSGMTLGELLEELEEHRQNRQQFNMSRQQFVQKHARTKFDPEDVPAYIRLSSQKKYTRQMEKDMDRLNMKYPNPGMNPPGDGVGGQPYRTAVDENELQSYRGLGKEQQGDVMLKRQTTKIDRIHERDILRRPNDDKFYFNTKSKGQIYKGSIDMPETKHDMKEKSDSIFRYEPQSHKEYRL